MRIASQFALELENHAGDWTNFPMPPRGERIGADLSMGFPTAFLGVRPGTPCFSNRPSVATSDPVGRAGGVRT